MAERILTGIKPTGQLTLGNYIGVLKNLAKTTERGESFIFIADLHALTLPIDPEVLRQNTIDLACFYLAAGLDTSKATLFLQSSVSAHAELNAILQNYLYMGELSRMTQFKDKSQKMKQDAIGLGLFAYPVLMAADIVLYDANVIPVGEDQVQHVEITRDLVNRINNRYGNILVMPKAELRKVGARIMSLSAGLYKTYSEYPLRRLMEAGVRICINTDDMTVSCTTLQEEWQHMIETFQLHEFEIGHLLLNSVDASFAPAPLKAQLRQIVQENYPSTILY